MSVDESAVGAADTVAAPEPVGPTSSPSDEALEAPRFRRVRRLGRRSLTVRLVTGVVALVAMLVVAIGATTYYALSTFLNQRFNQQLDATAVQNAGYFDRCVRTAHVTPSGGIVCSSGPQTQHEWVAAISPLTGEVFTFSSGYDVEALRLTEAQAKAILADPTATFTTHIDGNELRVTARQADDGLIVATGLSTREIERTLGRLLAAELIIGAVAVGVALCATAWGVRRSLRNLYRVTGTAQEVAAVLSPTGAGLDRRVPVAEEGTEVGQLAESFNTMLAAVETQFVARLESEQRMRQFLADASHELRTPLTSIRGYAELARMQRAAGDTAQDNLDRIESEGTRMSRLVDDLLMLARGDADDSIEHIERSPVDVAELLDDAVAGSRAAFPDRSISLRVGQLPAVLGDRDQLLRVVRNLITNAAVHTDAGRPIEVRGYPDADGVVISVIDGGPGLPPEAAAHVFERFWRADKARTRARGGSGLGLSIVAAVVRAHGGTVRFDSDVVRGTTVTVRLPTRR
jgi:two-component system OmpR family sensor kinase